MHAPAAPNVSERESWNRQKRFLLTAIAALAAGWLLTGVYFWRQNHQARADVFQERTVQEILPFEREIREVLEPLRYSGLQSIMKPGVSLALHFKERSWSLLNVRSFDSDGNVVLDERRFGACGELSTYAAGRIKKITGGRFALKFIKVGESDFFAAPAASHHALLLIDEQPPHKVYLVDPAFHRYGGIEQFLDRYFIFSVHDELPFMKTKSRGALSPVDKALPMFIKKNFMLSFSVQSINGIFDRNNYAAAWIATERGKFAGRSVLIVSKENGEVRIGDDPDLSRFLLSAKEYGELKDRLVQLFSSAEPRPLIPANQP
ncbi:MAG: hypothetical protein HYT79_03010 [Elusimicrobia bacterium]|nr:hypothetical protein [Elusimicrobiota bacterium]